MTDINLKLTVDTGTDLKLRLEGIQGRPGFSIKADWDMVGSISCAWALTDDGTVASDVGFAILPTDAPAHQSYTYTETGNTPTGGSAIALRSDVKQPGGSLALPPDAAVAAQFTITAYPGGSTNVAGKGLGLLILNSGSLVTSVVAGIQRSGSSLHAYVSIDGSLVDSVALSGADAAGRSVSMRVHPDGSVHWTADGIDRGAVTGVSVGGTQTFSWYLWADDGAAGHAGNVISGSLLIAASAITEPQPSGAIDSCGNEIGAELPANWASGNVFLVTTPGPYRGQTARENDLAVVLNDAGDVTFIPQEGMSTDEIAAAIAEAVASCQPLNANLTAEAGLTGAADKVSYYTGAGAKALAALTSFGRSVIALADLAALKTLLSLSKSDVGLGNVDNTSDANKPVSTATQTALDLKLNAADYVQPYRGKFTSPAALQTAIPTGADGDYAIIDAGTGTDAQEAIWDATDGWVLSASGTVTTTDQVTEGSTNLYFTTARAASAALNAVLTGLSTASSAVISATDTVLQALGKLQAQVSGVALITSDTYANIRTNYPAATYNGKRARCIDLNCDVYSDGSNWLPVNGRATLGTLSASFGIAPSGTVNYVSGAWSTPSGGTYQFDRVYSEGLFLYFNGISTTPAVPAGWYWVVMSSVTTGIIYDTNWSGGIPTIGSALTFTATGANVGASGSYISIPEAVAVVPGNSLGSRGQLCISAAFRTNQTAGYKYVQAALGGSALLQAATGGSTWSGIACQGEIVNRSASSQAGSGVWGGNLGNTVNFDAGIDTTIDQSITINLRTGGATEWLICDRACCELARLS